MQFSSLKRNLIIASLVSTLLTAGSVWAQVGTTSLRGTVTDKSGAVVANAKVSLTNAGQGLTRDMNTGNTGEYEFLALPPGTYSLTVEMQGFRKFENKNVQLLVNSPTTMNVNLEVGVTSQTVEVSAQAVTLNTTDATLGIAFDENQVKQLPMEGRNVPDLLSLQAGVLYTGNRSDINVDIDTRNGAVNGARSDQSNISLDGMPVNDSGGHAFKSVLPVTLDSVQEFRVTTTNYNADQGGSSGAQVALVTKSGTNDFHGSAYEYHRNTYTSANDYFVKAAQIENCNANGTPLSAKQCNQAPQLIRNVFGASVGGPVLKDRFYFFLNFEGTRRAEAASAVRTIPTDSLRDGIVYYLCKTASQCPAVAAGAAGAPMGVSGKSYAVPAGYFAVDQTKIKQMDPLGLGPNPASLAYFNSFPHPNDASVGDGFNYSGFRFSSPIKDTKNWYIGKLDYNLTKDAKQRLSLSGALANESNPLDQYLPSSPAGSLFNYTNARHTLLDYSRGLIANYSSVLSNSLVNNFRYGFIRESIGNAGDSNQTYIIMRGITQGVTRSQAFQIPSHNIVDDLSWSRGKHTLQFGGAISRFRNPRNSTLNSFSDGVTNGSWLDTAGMLVKSGSDFNPANNGFPAGAKSFANSYDFPMIALLGMVTEDDATYNYLKDGSVLAQGAPVSRHFAVDSYEMYVQDSWKFRPNVTITYGVRYSLSSPPWETNGLQVAPCQLQGSSCKGLDLGSWFDQRQKNMMQGIPSNQDPLVSFELAGPANGGKPGFYKWNKKDFGPRLALAWSPQPHSGLLKSLFGEGNKTAIRAGAAIVYDRNGSGLLQTFDSAGSFGLSTGLTNPAGIVTDACAPRLTDMHTIPGSDLGCPNDTPANTPTQILLPAPPGQFPQTFPSTLDSGGFAITWGLDNRIKTPYSYTFDFSVERQLPKGFDLGVSYVGRLSHWLWAQSDLAMPLNFKDPKSNTDYFTAAKALAKLSRSGVIDETFNNSLLPANVVQFWTDMIAPLQAGGAYAIGANKKNAIGGCFDTSDPAPPTSTTNPVLAAYDLFCANSLNETTSLFLLDYFGFGDANLVDSSGFSTAFYGPSTGFNTFFNPQYSSLYAWRSNTNANYNAMQVNFRHPMSHGIQFDFNYTYSKSIDISSDATRIGAWGGLGGQIINSWDPNAQRAVSDFDATHQFNANWIAELPFGKGKALAGNAHGALDAIIGGWQLSGLFRRTSGLPLNVSGGFNWPTNWQLGGNAFLTGSVQTGVFKGADASGNLTVSVFKNGLSGIDSFTAPFPGDSGARNQIRGDGFFNIDMGLAKRWHMPWSEKQSLQFRWEVFNVTNTTKFDVQSIAPEIDISSTFGNYTGLLTNPRVMQFALRFEF
ncbi:MAG TPA: carboxypeptidase-like regulatory domain-containing protein [Candidatus Acidoferrum sp.]|nr:carboxypeptidase-like regulatory domain-containing protein [Candidatus Acidoferrum sp.]